MNLMLGIAAMVTRTGLPLTVTSNDFNHNARTLTSVMAVRTFVPLSVPWATGEVEQVSSVL